MKLKRIKPGHYVTLDGRYEILRDPSGGDQPLGWGFASWLIFDNHDEECAAMMLGQNHFPTLRDARDALEAELARRAD